MSQICDTLTLKKCLKSNRLLEIQIINITLAQYIAHFRRSNQTTKTNERKRNTKKMREKRTNGRMKKEMSTCLTCCN